MSFTSEPPGNRSACPVCGSYRWAFDGYCLSNKCAGSFDDPMYPLSKPDHMRTDIAPSSRYKKPTIKKHPKPPKKGRRALELQYESIGEVAPWLEPVDNYE